MTITIPFPEHVEQQLRIDTPDLDDVAKEALLVSLYRQGKLTRKQLAGHMEKDRWETEELLRKHNVTEDLPTIEEIREQIKTAAVLRTKG